MLRKMALCLYVAAATFSYVQEAGAQQIRSVRVATGIAQPCFVTAPPGDTTRLFIVEQRRSQGTLSRADIRILDLTTNPPTLLPTPFLTINGISTGDEQGLLGLAFHPDYATNRTFFVNFTTPNTNIVRYKASESNPNVADPASATTILTFSQPFSNHNGGWIGFGPDGYLYVATGDGGSANDPNNNGQTLTTVLGKMLRISVSDTGTYTVPANNPFPGATAPFNTIWAYGLRNPWRPSFDRGTGNLYIADVGQGAREEVNVQPADNNGNMGGRNYGWRCMEGFICTPNCAACSTTCSPCDNASLTRPVHDYDRSGGRCSVTGGYVYRGAAISGLQGHYFFADYCAAQIYSFQYTGVSNPAVTNRTSSLSPSIDGGTISAITSFGEDAAGEIYICKRGSTSASTGEIFKIVNAPPANDSCATAIGLSPGNAVAFTTVGATSAGPDEAGCGLSTPQIGNDVWYQFFAQCTGTAVVSVCDASFDTRLAAYSSSCPTGPGTALACNDDACGTASQLAFPVTNGSLYRIRLGGTNGATGTGTIVFNCNVPPACPGNANNDEFVNVADLLAVISNWGPCAGCPADFNNDAVINVADLLTVISNWGPCPSGFAGDSNSGDIKSDR